MSKKYQTVAGVGQNEINSSAMFNGKLGRFINSEATATLGRP